MKIINYEFLEALECYCGNEMLQKKRYSFEVLLEENNELKDFFEFFLKFKSEKGAFGSYLLKQELKELDREVVNGKSM